MFSLNYEIKSGIPVRTGYRAGKKQCLEYRRTAKMRDIFWGGYYNRPAKGDYQKQNEN